MSEPYTRAAALRFGSTALALSTIWLGTLFSALFGFVANLALSHALSVPQFGALTSALTTVALAGTLGGYGVGEFWLRKFGLEGSAGQRWIMPSLHLIELTTAVTIGLFAVIAPMAFSDHLNVQLIYILFPLAISQIVLDLAQTRFQLEDNHTSVAAVQAAPNLMRMVVAAFALLFTLDSVQTAASLSLVAAMTTLGVGFGLVRASKTGFRLPTYRVRPAEPFTLRPTARDVVVNAFPFALSTVSYPLYFQGGLLTLSIIGTNHSTGVFSVAFLVLTAIYLLPAVTYQKYLTGRMHWWAEHDRPMFARVHRIATLALAGSGALLALATWLLSQTIIDHLFADAFADAGPVLATLAFAIPFRFVSSAMGGTLLTGDHVRLRVMQEVLATAITIGTTAVLFPRYGVQGVAIASVVSEMYLCVVYTLTAARITQLIAP